MSMDRAPNNSLPQNTWELNQPDPSEIPCVGYTLGQLRLRLRAMLSSYAQNTLIPSDIDNDLEAQYINDGVSQLWPHDYQIVMHSQPIGNSPPKTRQTRYFLPDDCEHIISAWTGQVDINDQRVKLNPIVHYDQWMFDSAYIDASTFTTSTGPWLDSTKKTLVIQDRFALMNSWVSPQDFWIIVRYARKWPLLVHDTDCINPTGNRIQAIIFYAAHAFFNSQYEVNSESIRYQNYLGIANRLYQLFMQQVVRDSKPLYIS